MKKQIITSRSNAFIKKIFSLLNRKGRENSGLFWAEGNKAVESAIRSKKYEISDVVLSAEAGKSAAELSRLAEEKGIKIQIISADCFEKISALRHPEGIGVVAKIRSSAALPETTEKPAVILWQMQNPGNQGAVIRSAAAFGCDVVILVEPCVDENHPLCVRATSGAFFFTDFVRTTSEKLMPWLEKYKKEVVAISPDAEEKISAAYSKKILIIGNEPHGIEEKIKKEFKTVAIPMKPKVESLNTSCAASIAMYEMWGSRKP